MADFADDDFFLRLDKSSENKSDPWSPVNSEPQKQEGFLELTSDKYLASLETRLKKLKSSKESEKVTAKELLAGLKSIKEAHMNNLVEATGQPYISDYMPDDNRKCASQSYVQKRLHPEKIALTKEENKILVEEDNLGMLTVTNKLEKSDSETVKDSCCIEKT